jgi:hypothetical protein
MKLLQTSLCFLVFSLTGYSNALVAVAKQSPQPQPEQINQNLNLPSQTEQPHQMTLATKVKFKPRLGSDRPVTIGGGTRGQFCLKNHRKVIPLLPEKRNGLTLAERPTFYWYVPQTTVKTAKFTIRTDNEQTLFYTIELSLPSEAGIISFTLPAAAPSLAVNKDYHVYLTVICDQSDFSRNPSVDSWVKRVEPDVNLSQALVKANKDIGKQLRLYADGGIWHEALVTLVQMRCSQPNDLIVKLTWREFLESVGLKNVVSESLNSACTEKN